MKHKNLRDPPAAVANLDEAKTTKPTAFGTSLAVIKQAMQKLHDRAKSRSSK